MAVERSGQRSDGCGPVRSPFASGVFRSGVPGNSVACCRGCMITVWSGKGKGGLHTNVVWSNYKSPLSSASVWGER